MDNALIEEMLRHPQELERAFELHVQRGRSISATPRQQDLMAYLAPFIAKHGYAPTYQQMADAIGMKSKSGIMRLVDGLVDRGHLRRLPGKPRSLTLGGGAT